MVTTKLNLSMTEPSVRQIYAKQGDTGRVLDITLDQTPEDGTLRILRPDGTEVTSEAVTGGEVESGSSFESLTEADVTELTVGIEPVQDLSHGDPSPSNICPITGHDEVTVTRTGKNLLDNTAKSGQTSTSGGISCTINSDGSVAVSGTATSQTINAWFVDGYSTSYKLSRFSAGTYTFTDFIPFYHYVDETNLRSVPTYFYSRSVTYTFTKDWWLDGVRCPAAETGTEYNLTLYPQIELGSTATAYEPYRSNTYTTSLGQTVYGGTLDLASGVLTVDRVCKTLTTARNLSGTYGGSIIYNSSSAETADADFTKPIQTNNLAYVGNSVTNFRFGTCINANGTSFNLWIKDGAFANLSEASAWLVANETQLCYYLANPVTYQLTAQQIKTLVGTNNVWASSGDIVSIKFAYDGLLSELPSGATSVVGKCYCDVEQNGVSSMPFTLNVKKNERES